MSWDDFYQSSLRRMVVTGFERFGGSRIGPCLQQLDETQRYSRQDLETYRWQKLRTLLEHAYTFVPYYRRILDDIGMKPGDFRDPQDLRKIPVLTKKMVRENVEALRTTGSARPMKVVGAQTGGTTGEPLKFLRDTDCISFTRAALLRSYAWTGYRIGSPLLFFTGGSLLASPQSLKQRIGFSMMNYHFMPAFSLRSDTLSGYVDLIRAKGIRFMRGYSTILYQFAALCEEAGIEDLRIEAVYPTAEMLTIAQRQTIERALGCTIYDQYGAAEINVLANECPEGRQLHIIEEHVIMEEVDTADDGQNALVITDLDNRAQPFIRYAIADRGKIGDTPCRCGRNLAVLEEFLGRSSDDIVLPSGERYPGVFFHHLFGHFEGVDQFQIVQDSPGKLLVKIVKNTRHRLEDETKIRELIEEHTRIVPDIEYCASIPRSPSGKITSVISDIA